MQPQGMHGRARRPRAGAAAPPPARRLLPSFTQHPAPPPRPRPPELSTTMPATAIAMPAPSAGRCSRSLARSLAHSLTRSLARSLASAPSSLKGCLNACWWAVLPAFVVGTGGSSGSGGGADGGGGGASTALLSAAVASPPSARARAGLSSSSCAAAGLVRHWVPGREEEVACAPTIGGTRGARADAFPATRAVRRARRYAECPQLSATMQRVHMHDRCATSVLGGVAPPLR